MDNILLKKITINHMSRREK